MMGRFRLEATFEVTDETRLRELAIGAQSEMARGGGVFPELTTDQAVGLASSTMSAPLSMVIYNLVAPEVSMRLGLLHERPIEPLPVNGEFWIQVRDLDNPDASTAFPHKD